MKRGNDTVSAMFLVAITLLVATCLADRDIRYTAPEPYPGYRAFVKTCKAGLTFYCGQEIYGFVFASELINVTDECCIQLIKNGQSCHTTLVEHGLTRPDLKDRVAQAHQGAKDIWEKCSKVAPVSS